MPTLHVTTGLPWGPGGSVHLGALRLPWGYGSAVHAVMGPYTPSPPPAGGVPIATRPPLTALYSIGHADAYLAVHTLDAVDLRTGDPVELTGAVISMDADSVLWRLQAQAAPSAYAALNAGTDPVIVRVTIDGIDWDFLVDSVSRSRRFGATDVSITGRSVVALTGQGCAQERNWTNDAPNTAFGIAAGAHIDSGLELEWAIPDWIVPAGALSFTGTPLALTERLAAAAGAPLRAARSGLRLRVMPRYSYMPSEWSGEAPDVDVAWSAVQTEQTERDDEVPYDAVVVLGTRSAYGLQAVLASTPGLTPHPQVTDELVTEPAVAISRASSVLGQSGRKAMHTLTLPVLTGAGEPGVLEPGQLVRVLDPAGTWVGMVRGVSVRAALPEVEQTVVLERHLDDLIPPESLRFVGPEIPDQTFAGEVSSGQWWGMRGAASKLVWREWLSTQVVTRWRSGQEPLLVRVMVDGAPEHQRVLYDPPSPHPVGPLDSQAHVVVRVIDAAGDVADSNEFSVTLTGPELDFVGSIGDQSFAVGVPFTLDISSHWSGGVPPLTWSLQTGTLPTGLGLDAATGVISGTPTSGDPHSGVVFRATDYLGQTQDSGACGFSAGASDPYWDDVYCLMHFDEASSSVAVVDEKGHSTYQSGGGMDVATAPSGWGKWRVAKGGRYAYAYKAGSEFASYPDIDFCFEARVRFAHANASVVMGIGVIGSADIGVYLQAGTFWVYAGESDSGASLSLSTATTYHVAVVKTGSGDAHTYKLYVDGVLTETVDISGYYQMEDALHAFIGSDSGSYETMVDEFRVTLNRERYTANFAPPTEPHPNG